jgi:hypothetical protein
VISYQIYSWILNGVFHLSPFINYYDGTLAKTKKIILISDWFLRNSILRHTPSGLQIEKVYNPDSATLLAKFGDMFQYLYTRSVSTGVKHHTATPTNPICLNTEIVIAFRLGAKLTFATIPESET